MPRAGGGRDRSPNQGPRIPGLMSFRDTKEEESEVNE